MNSYDLGHKVRSRCRQAKLPQISLRRRQKSSSHQPTSLLDTTFLLTTTIHNVSPHPLDTNTSRLRPEPPNLTMPSHPPPIPHSNIETTLLLTPLPRTTPQPARSHNTPPPRSRATGILQTPFLLRSSGLRLRHAGYLYNSNVNPVRSVSFHLHL